MAFYIGFIAFVFPTQWFAQRFDQAKYLGANVVFWAILVIMKQGRDWKSYDSPPPLSLFVDVPPYTNLQRALLLHS